MLNTPALVIAAYNRPHSLQRLLDSISKAVYPSSPIILILSIDKSENQEVLKIAQDFQWKNGEKIIIEHTENLGLRKHILACGDLTEKYNSIILLEDDLIVSPQFYQYSIQAISFFFQDERISQISLYSYAYNEFAQSSFLPLQDGFDNYFMQLASSWGQIWTKPQWEHFKTWYGVNNQLNFLETNIPESVKSWPSSSWKKYYIAFMVQTNRYAVYPRLSLSTNFAEKGVHYIETSDILQVQLQHLIHEYNFCPLDLSQNRYDAFMEYIFPKENSPEMDLFGLKKIKLIKADLIISSKPCRKPIQSYSNSLIPPVMNIFMDISGKYFHLGRKEDFLEDTVRHKKLINVLTKNNLSLIEIIFLFYLRLKLKLFR